MSFFCSIFDQLPKGSPSKIRSHFRANNKFLHKKSHLVQAQSPFLCIKTCKFGKFVVSLQRI